MRISALAVLLVSYVCIIVPDSLLAQSDEFVPVFDGTFDGWTIENTDADNFTIVDGILHVEGGGGWLRSDRQYSDFVLRSEFRWLTSDADSGIYVRAVADSEFVRGWPNNSYQVQVRDPAGESRFPPVGGLFRHGTPAGESELDEDAVIDSYLGTRKWHVIQIEVVGDLLTVRLNGTQIGHANNIVNPTGYIGVQSELGTIEYRSIEINER